MSIRYHVDDLSDLAPYTTNSVAIDTETLGLNPLRDRLCVVQLSPGDGTADVIQVRKGGKRPDNLIALLTDASVTKIFHFARFDMAVLYHAFGIMPAPVYCTKIASKLTRTYTDRHGLKDLAKELLNVDMTKVQQSSDWAADRLTPAQLDYAASDVLHLHALKVKLQAMLEREDRADLARASFDYLPTRARLDLMGWSETDIFAHS